MVTSFKKQPPIPRTSASIAPQIKKSLHPNEATSKVLFQLVEHKKQPTTVCDAIGLPHQKTMTYNYLKEKNGALTASESPKVLHLVCWFYWSIYIIIIQHTKYECCCQNYKWWKEERTLL